MICIFCLIFVKSINSQTTIPNFRKKNNDLIRKESFEAFGKWGNKEKGEEWRAGGCWLWANKKLRQQIKKFKCGWRENEWEKKQQREKIEWDVGSKIGCFRPGSAARVPGLCRQHHVHRQILWVRHNDDVQEDPGGDCSDAACLSTSQLRMIGNVSGFGKTWSLIKCLQNNPKCTGKLQFFLLQSQKWGVQTSFLKEK